MRAPERIGRALLVLFALAAAPLHAESAPAPSDVARDLWGLLHQMRGGADQRDTSLVRPHAAHPMAIPAAGDAGPVLDLSDLSHPLDMEAALGKLSDLPDSEVRVTIPNGAARLGSYSVGSEQSVAGHLLVLRGDAEVFGRLNGNLVTYDGDVVVHPGAVIAGDVLAVHGKVQNRGGEIQGESRTLAATRQPATPVQPASAVTLTLRRLAGVIGVFLALACLGWVLASFARNNLQTVADTASHNFGRSFVTGLIGQILLLPTFGMLVVGLILSVAGILLLPFAVIVYALLVIVGVVGGFLAVAHAMGEIYTRRRQAAGALLGEAGSARFVMVGLAAVVALWLAWAVFGWVPIAGSIVRGAAVMLTWLLGTAGLGAAMLSRAGIKGNFAGHIIPPEALTDEYLWATPRFGVPAAKRPGAPAPPRQR
ncbi:MAG TPA: polymer-forming cytoskeletal protein [Gemmatimonadales bacterium]|nr:polymer-forming cytoskeletal protein [Gemmatimonadales bacterium]